MTEPVLPEPMPDESEIKELKGRGDKAKRQIVVISRQTVEFKSHRKEYHRYREETFR